MLNMFAAMAQFEREMMLERQREGIAKAKAEGKYKGRKPTAGLKADDAVSPTATASGLRTSLMKLDIGGAASIARWRQRFCRSRDTGSVRPQGVR